MPWFVIVGANDSIWGLLFFNRSHRITEMGKLGAPRNSSPVPLVYKRENCDPQRGKE